MGGGIAHKLSTFVVLDASSLSEKHYVLGVCDDAFKESIIQRDIYFDLLKKIHQKGKFIYAHNGKVLGYCAFYANDLEKRNAYISLIAVRPEYQRMQVGVKLLNASFEEMRNCGMKQCLLEVRKNNLRAIRFYKINQFVILEERKESYIMKCDL